MAKSLLITAAALLFATGLHGRSPDVDAILERLDDYLAVYESQLSAVVADERLIQQTEGRYRSTQRRQLDSDMAFLRLPGNLEWLGFRSVTRVDGKALAGGRSLTELLAVTSADAMAQARLLVECSSKYNLGNPRTVNVPTLPLELLSGKYRHRYDITIDGRAEVRGRVVDVLELVELGPPPIVYNGGAELRSRVRAWIETRTGALWRAEVELQVKRVSPSRIRVEFAEDRALQIVVPIEMREDVTMSDGSGRGKATYTNFRRFQTSARIVPPPP